MLASQAPSRALTAHGSYPTLVYRAFTQREYAEDFAVRGRFRVGNLRMYQRIEDSNRQDSTEGEGRFQYWSGVTTVDFFQGSDATAVRQRPGYVNAHVELLHPIFVLSCATPHVDLAWFRRRFGSWVIKIEGPRRFAQEVSEYLQRLPHKFAGGVEGCFVKYYKGARLRRNPSRIESVTLSYSQKSPAFCDEHEFRFVVTVMDVLSREFNQDYFTIDLGRRLEYVSILDVP